MQVSLHNFWQNSITQQPVEVGLWKFAVKHKPALQSKTQNDYMTKISFYQKWTLTSPDGAFKPYVPPHQTWCRYLKGRPSYGDLCIFKMVAAAILNLLPVPIFGSSAKPIG